MGGNDTNLSKTNKSLHAQRAHLTTHDVLKVVVTEPVTKPRYTRRYQGIYIMRIRGTETQ